MPQTTFPDTRIELVLKAIRTEPLRTTTDLARLTNLSPSRLSHLFRQCTGSSLNTFLSQRRMDAAAEMLLTSNLRIKEISYTLGYRHEASFVRAFVRKFGVSPGGYRRRRPFQWSDSHAS